MFTVIAYIAAAALLGFIAIIVLGAFAWAFNLVAGLFSPASSASADAIAATLAEVGAERSRPRMPARTERSA